MRIVVDRGSNTGAISDYLHRKDKREKGKEQDDPVFHSNLFGRNSQERTEELRFSADLNQRVLKTYVHYKVSFPPGENPDIETKKGIVEDVLSLRGHGQNCQFFAVEHHEKVEKHNVHHLHILTSAIRLDGTWVDDSFERVKLKQVEREIELKRGLRYCPPKQKGDRNSTPIRELKLREKLQAEGKRLTKDALREAIQQAASDGPTMPLLLARLKALGYSVQFHEFTDGGKGISYAAEGKAFKGRDLGDPFSFEGLYKYAGVDYQPERDDARLRELNHLTPEECQQIVEQAIRAESILPMPVIETPPEEQKLIRERLAQVKLIEKIQEHGKRSPSVVALAVRLKAEGIRLEFQQQGEKVTGIAYEMDGFNFEGALLGAAYSFDGLQTEFGLSYQPSNNQQLFEIQQMTDEQCRALLMQALAKKQAEREQAAKGDLPQSKGFER